MVSCEYCGDETATVWRHRAYGETTTHRRTRWVCADCHPTLARAAAGAGTG